MIPQIEQQVIVIFKTGIQISGIVVSWSDEKSVLKTSSETSFIVINSTKQDVMFYKIFNGELKEKAQEIIEKPIKTDDDIKSLVELKGELNNLEREEISEKLKSQHITSSEQRTYGYPTSILKKPSNKEYTGEEVKTKDQRIADGLRNLLNKNKGYK